MKRELVCSAVVGLVVLIACKSAVNSMKEDLQAEIFERDLQIEELQEKNAGAQEDVNRLIGLVDAQTEDILQLTSDLEYTRGEVETLGSLLEAIRDLGYLPRTLTRSGGVCYYDGHIETYYNLDMSRVVDTARQRIAGYADAEVWERFDGCKMLGAYIMLAADYAAYPYGSIVETSLGAGIVVDTGVDSPNKIDVAVTW